MNRLPRTLIPADPVLTGQAITRKNPRTSNSLAVFQAKYQGGSNGVQVDITSGIAINALSIRLLRGFSRDPNQAKIIQTWSGPFTALDNLEYIDTSAQVLSAMKVYYWASIIYEQTPALISQLFGPQTAFINAASGSEQITAFSVSINPDGAVIDVSVSFQLPSGSDFGSAQVFLTGYNRISAPQLVAQGSASPFTFTLVPTGETVTIQVNAITQSGTLVTGVTTQQLHLTSSQTLPAIIYNGQAISNTVGNQISWSGSIEKNVTQMKVYRQTSGGTFTGATLIATVALTPEKNYIVTDQIANPQNFIYFITAVNNIGESSPSPAITPGQAASNASQGTGATAGVYMVTTTIPGVGNGITFVSSAPISNQGSNYFAQPLVTFSPPASGGRVATGRAVLDGSGHVTFIQITDGGSYSSSDSNSTTCTIHY